MVKPLYLSTPDGDIRHPNATFDDFLDRKHSDLLNAFDAAILINGTYTTVEGWIVDARRHDLDNLKNLLDVANTHLWSDVQVRMADDSTVTMPVSRLATLIGELQLHGLSLYQHKWQRMSELEACTTIEEVEAVVW